MFYTFYNICFYNELLLSEEKNFGNILKYLKQRGG